MFSNEMKYVQDLEDFYHITVPNVQGQSPNQPSQ